MRKMYQWRPILDMPKRIHKDCMVVYRYAESVCSEHRSNDRPEMYSLNGWFGSRVITHFMIIDKYKEEDDENK